MLHEFIRRRFDLNRAFQKGIGKDHFERPQGQSNSSGFRRRDFLWIIEGIAQHGVTGSREVNADLMRSSGGRSRFHQRGLLFGL